jgi:hypothetical protein
MKNQTSTKHPKWNLGTIPVYPILFGLYPVLALTAFNISQIDLNLTYRSILISLALAVSIYGILRLVVRDWQRAALISLLWLILFFSYGHVYMLLKNQAVLGTLIGRHRYLLAIWFGLAIIAILALIGKSRDLTSLTRPLNIIFLLLLVFPLFQIAYFQMRALNRGSGSALASAGGSSSSADQIRPDIYYIILDGYGRSDALNDVYQLDNSKFMQALEDRGFFVAKCSQSNYPYTQYSLASSLNLNYLNLSSPNLKNTMDFLSSNAIRQTLAEKGYTIVAFETGFRWTQWEDADVYYTLDKKASAINDFESLYLETTPVRVIVDYETARYLEKLVNLREVASTLNYGTLTYERGFNTLQSLRGVAGEIKSPKFVFAHLLIAHPPYVFGPNGEQVPEATTDQEKETHYKGALVFLDSQMPGVIDSILAQSATPPIIIIQGDHGSPTWNEPYQHMAILNAYYLPGHKDALYPSISPVNTFRLILNSYFGDHYPLLDDVSWFSEDFQHPSFSEIANPCKK